MEQWLPKISKVNAVDRDRPISLNIFADVCLVDRNAKVLAWISVADLVWRGAIPPQTGGKESERVRIRREGGCGKHDGCEEGLIRHFLLALLLSSQESFQNVLAFLFEIIRLGRAFE